MRNPCSLRSVWLALILTAVSPVSPWPNLTGRLESASVNSPPRPVINNLGLPLGYIRVVNGEITKIHWHKAAACVLCWFMIMTCVNCARHEYLDYRDFRRKRVGWCTGCGYDLRGSTEACPECGRPTGARRS